MAAAVQRTLAETCRLDGRGVRLAESAATMFDDSLKQLKSFMFEFDHQYAALAGDSLAAFQKQQSNLKKKLSALKINVKAMQRRISTSVNKASLAKEEKELIDMSDTISNLLLFSRFLKGPTADLNRLGGLRGNDWLGLQVVVALPSQDLRCQASTESDFRRS